MVEEAVKAVGETGLSAGWADAEADGNSTAPAARACAVLGCGVMGLSTAILMQRRGWRVTIYTKDVPPNTTSNIAGGLWGPSTDADPGMTPPDYEERFERGEEAWDLFALRRLVDA